MVGEQFDVGTEICGAKLSIRFSEDIISLWNRHADNIDATNKIRDQMRRSMRLPQVQKRVGSFSRPFCFAYSRPIHV